ncbi:MAG TPA: phosphotransferase [Terracidiphilus sp.]|nr:phosphotransferase [Terracidiphilus sp.]
MSETVKAHGLNGRLVEPDWRPLTIEELRPLLAEFPAAGAPREILFASPRPLSAAAVVRTERGRVFVKRHARAVRDAEGLLEEHRFMEHLAENRASVPRVLRNAGGQSAIERGSWTYEVHEPASGIDLYGEAQSWTPFRSAAHARAAGEALARLHCAAEGFDAPRRKAQPLVASFTIFADPDADEAMRLYLAARPELAGHAAVRESAQQALELLAPFHAELCPRLPELRPLWTHNDLHASNLLWSDTSPNARATAVIDFGLADRTNAVHDLAHAIERNIIEWLSLVEDPAEPDRVPVHSEHLEALLAGYEQVRALNADEAAALAPMLALCHAEFALSEAEYFLGVLHSEESARMAYSGWLVGHSRWFHSAAGRRLLDFLRRRADRRAFSIERAARA